MKLHDKGGSSVPYEKFHVDGIRDRTKDATESSDGLMTAEIFSENQRTSIPSHCYSTGLKGQWAADNDYLYFCMRDNSWVRTALMEFNNIIEHLLNTEEDGPYLFEDGYKWVVEGS